MQLVPQCTGLLDEYLIDTLQANHPGTAFRLHANVRVLPGHQLADLSSFDTHIEWWRRAAAVNKHLGSPTYSAHAGRRRNATLAQVLDNARRAADLFGSTVAIEGLYPDPTGQWLLSSWAEYETLLHCGVPFALDLSHLNIVATASGRQDIELAKALVTSPMCVEIHVSGNDGSRDSHGPIPESTPWWMPALELASSTCTIFSESIQ